MNNIKNLISELEDELLHATKEISTAQVDGRLNDYHHFIGFTSACNRHIQELKLLLNEQPEAITEDSHLRKHDVGRSAASKEISDKESSGESSSETAIVGQNEQTREDYEPIITCGVCGEVCHIVRPGKWQCSRCD